MSATLACRIRNFSGVVTFSGALRRSERRRATARKLRPVRSAAAFERDLSRCLARPKRTEIDRRVPRSPALPEALDRRAQNDILALLPAEPAGPANRRHSRADHPHA